MARMMDCIGVYLPGIMLLWDSGVVDWLGWWTSSLNFNILGVESELVCFEWRRKCLWCLVVPRMECEIHFISFTSDLKVGSLGA